MALLNNGKIMAQGKKKEILTETLLSEMFGMNVRVEWENERPWLIIR